MLGVRRPINKKNESLYLLDPLGRAVFGSVRFAPSVRRASEIVAERAALERARSMAGHPSAQAQRQAVA
jgi:hypothetical protein